MQEIKTYQLGENIPKITKDPYVIIGEPCKELLLLQEEGYCVLAELKYLQDLEEEAVAKSLSEEEAVLKYKNVCIDASKLPQAYFRRIWCRHTGEPMMIAETERAIIRESIPEDAVAFMELYKDEKCRKYLEPLPVVSEDGAGYGQYLEAYQKGQYTFYEYGMWSIIEKKTNTCIGRAGLENITLDKKGTQGISLGYAVLPEFRGRGYAKETCREILKYYKACGLEEKIYVKIHYNNEASMAIYQNMKLENIVDLILITE